MRSLFTKAFLVLAAALLIGGSAHGVQASAAEENLIGLSSEYLRIYIDPNGTLGVVSDEFVDENLQVLSIDGKAQLLSQVAYANVQSYVNIRSGPSTDYEIVGRLYPGGMATAVASENGWTKIISGQIEGYIRSDFLLFGEDAVKAAETYYSKHYRVVSSTLNLRASASTDSTIKAQLFKNADLTLIEVSGDWLKVTWNGTASSVTGYVHSSYVSNEYKYAVSPEEAKDFEEKNSYSLSNIIWPLPGNRSIAAYFGYRVPPCAGASSYHRGLDIGGASGLSIVAALSGTIIGTGYDSSAGNYVILDSGNGVVTKYYHCSKILVSTGEKVTQGQTIAKVGSTGISTGPHLHFALVLNGNYVDPYPYLKSVQYK